jgi:hypothetical protein
MDQRCRNLVEIGNRLFSQREPMNRFFQECCEQFYAARADYTGPISFGEDFAAHHDDSYPEQARETLANAIEATLRNGDWFEVKTGFEEIDEVPAVASWFEGATKRFRRLIYDRRANFKRATTEADHDWVSIGNLVVSVEESPDRSHFYFRSWHVRDCAWMENELGAVDHIHRKMKMSARNIVRRWRDKVPATIKQVAEKNPSQEFEVRHIVLPTEEYYGDDRAARRRAQRMPFTSLYVLADGDNQAILSEGGLPVFNYVVARWRTISGWQYGFSPASAIALPDARMLQSIARAVLESAEKAVDPPLVATEEAIRSDINVYAGGVTWVSQEYDETTGVALRPLDIAGNVGLGMDIKQDVRRLIAEAFLLNKLWLPQGEKTAYETQVLMGEYRRAILPFFNPIEDSYHLPLLDTAFQMALRNGAFNFEEMPDEIDGAEVTFVFDSPLNTAEGRATVAQFNESVQIVAAAAQFDPQLPARYDLRKATDDAVRGTGAPADWMIPDEDLGQIDAEAAQQAELAKAAEMLGTGASVGQAVGDATLSLQQAGLVGVPA